jgi:hypothetical protein
LGEEYRSLSSSLCSVLHYPLASFLLGPNILLSLLSSHNVSAQVSHPCKTTGKIYISVYIILYIFGQPTARQKILH